VKIEFNDTTIAVSDGRDLFRDFSICLETNTSGKIVAILGNSGIGKSTLLRVIADQASRSLLLKSGQISVSPAGLTSYLPQQPVFVEGKSVQYNLSLLDGIAGSSKRELETARSHYISLLGIRPLLSRRSVSDLSGGERQRVMIARTLAFRPRALLLDEPMTSLDPQIRAELLWSLRSIIREEGILGIYITHDVTEAFAYADEVVFLSRSDSEPVVGAHQAYGTAQFFADPPSIAAAYFLKSPFFVALPVRNGGAGMNAAVSASCYYIGFDSRDAAASLEDGEISCTVVFHTPTAIALTTEAKRRFLLPMATERLTDFSVGSTVRLKLTRPIWEYDAKQCRL
jgi:ABC-type nitrate/sulfonate/bicarbonate transport system ATPase subunit